MYLKYFKILCNDIENKVDQIFNENDQSYFKRNVICFTL